MLLAIAVQAHKLRLARSTSCGRCVVELSAITVHIPLLAAQGWSARWRSRRGCSSMSLDLVAAR
jgi:hypothetical protein